MLTRRGFTLVEIMVVMSIIAILALLGVSALLGINNANMVDKATEEIVTDIRDSQNKAISVANATATVIPVAWGYQINPSTKQVTPFYIETGAFTKKDLDTTTYGQMDSITINGADNPIYIIYAAPFGKFFATSVAPNGWTNNWSYSPVRPKDAILSVASETYPININLSYRNNTKTITIAENGDVYAQ